LALFDPVSITRKIEATPFSSAPNVVISNPHREDNPASFLERNMASVLLTDLRVAQPSLFDALAEVNAGFNPIKQLDDQRRQLLGG